MLRKENPVIDVETVVTIGDEIVGAFSSRRTDTVSGRFVIFGAGGAGTWVAIALAMAGEPGQLDLLIVDGDELELSNLNRLPYPVTWALDRKAKAAALGEYLRYLRPWIRVSYLVHFVRETDDAAAIIASFAPVDAVVEATDNPRAQRFVREACRKLGVALLAVHYDGPFVTVQWYPAKMVGMGWQTARADQVAGYTVSSNAFAPMMLGVLAVAILRRKPLEPLSLRINVDELPQILARIERSG